MLRLVLGHPLEALGVYHFGGQQAGAAELADDLAEGVVRVARHWGLENGRVDEKWPDSQRLNRGQRPKFVQRLTAFGRAKVASCSERTHGVFINARVRARNVR